MFYAQKLTEMITKSKFSRVFHPSLAKQEHLYYTVTQQTLCKCSNTSQEKWYFTPLSQASYLLCSSTQGRFHNWMERRAAFFFRSTKSFCKWWEFFAQLPEFPKRVPKRCCFYLLHSIFWLWNLPPLKTSPSWGFLLFIISTVHWITSLEFFQPFLRHLKIFNNTKDLMVFLTLGPVTMTHWPVIRNSKRVTKNSNNYYSFKTEDIYIIIHV